MQKRINLVISILALVIVIMAISHNMSDYSSKRETVQAEVVMCEEITIYNAEKYHVTENGKMSTTVKYETKNLYNITVDINGEDYVVTREKCYEVGESISVTMITQYHGSELLKRECK